MKIAAFDVATSVGICVGEPGEKKPFVATWDLRAAGTARPRRLLYFSDACDELFSRTKVDAVRFEAPLPLRVMMKIGTSEEVMLLLRGAIGVLEACAARAGIDDIGSFDVKDARHHFIGQRTVPRDSNGKSGAKPAVMKMCRMMGIDVKDDNSADAVAGWSLCCSRANPRLAHLVTPLFQQTD